MDKRTVRKLTAAAGLGASLLIGSSFVSSAWAGPCAAGSVAQYTTPGFSCTVGPLTFSNFVVVATMAGNGIVDDSAWNAFNPDTLVVGGHTEYGFSLGYSAFATGIGVADISVKYDVSSSPGSMVDAYMAFTGGASGPLGFSDMSETLSNGTTMTLIGPGATSTTFAAIDILQAIKDQTNTAFGAPGTSTAFASVLVDGFSVTGVPEPGTIALFGAGLLAGGLFLRRRRLLSR
jgi:hypothetical protein